MILVWFLKFNLDAYCILSCNVKESFRLYSHLLGMFRAINVDKMNHNEASNYIFVPGI